LRPRVVLRTGAAGVGYADRSGAVPCRGLAAVTQRAAKLFGLSQN
jgi:hypothetical protein